MNPSRTHNVARAAFKCVDAHARSSSSESEKRAYGALAHKLPGMILQNGLAQVTGFLLAKGKKEHDSLIRDLAKVLSKSGAIEELDAEDLHKQIIDSELHRYIFLTRRSLEASGWLKRYVQGVLRVGPTGETDGKEATDGNTAVT